MCGAVCARWVQAASGGGAPSAPAAVEGVEGGGEPGAANGADGGQENQGGAAQRRYFKAQP